MTDLDKQAKAIYSVRSAVKSGRLVRPTICEICGRKQARGCFGHHYLGYDHPLEVWWVCVTCNNSLREHDGSLTKAEAIERFGKSSKEESTAGIEFLMFISKWWHWLTREEQVKMIGHE